MAIEIKIISAAGVVRTVEVEPGEKIPLQSGDTVVLAPDAEVAISTSRSGDNLVIATPDGNIEISDFFVESEGAPLSKAVAFFNRKRLPLAN